VIRIELCGHCGVWAAWLTCASCGAESRQLGVEGDWATSESLGIDPADEIIGDQVSCCSCGYSGFVDALKRSRVQGSKIFTFDVDYDSEQR